MPKVGNSYNKTLNRSGGVAPFTWSVTPPLPGGLNLKAWTGEITGIPEEGTDGTYAHTFTVQDSSTPTSQTVSKLIELKIKEAEIKPGARLDGMLRPESNMTAKEGFLLLTR